MVYDYTSVSDVATRQILDKGRSFSYISVGASSYNSTLDELQGAIETTYASTGLFTDVRQNDIDGDLVKLGDKTLIISGKQNFAPKTNDVVILDQTRYKIIAVRTISPGNTAVLYKLQIRR